MIKHLLTVLFFSLLLFQSNAQIDTSFWFVAPRVPAAIGVNSVSLQFSSYSHSVAVLVRQPANSGGVSLSFTLAASSTTVINLTASQALIVSSTANTADTKGLYISSTDLISSNYVIESNIGQESISLKGQAGSGSDFFVPFSSSLNSLTTGSLVNAGFDIVAQEPGITNLLISPRADIVGHSKGNTFLTTLTQGQTYSGQEITRGKNPAGIVAADFNGDLLPDVALIDQPNNLLFVFINTGLGTFTESANYMTGVAPTKIITNDVNYDTFADLIVTNSISNNVSVFLGTGTGAFSTGTTFTTGVKPVSVACGDINSDGLKDLVVVNNLGNSISLLTGSGSGSFSSFATYSVGSFPTDVALGTFTNTNGTYTNTTGSDFIAVTNSNSNNMSVFYQTATLGTFTMMPLITTGTNPSAIISGYFNADTLLDLAVANRGANNITVYTGKANKTWTLSTNYAVASNPVAVLATTVNSGPVLDLVVSNYGGNSISVLLGTSSGTNTSFAAAVSSGINASPISIANADFNNDGQQDIVAANYSSALFTRRLNSNPGSATLTAATSGTTSYGLNLPSQLAGSIVSSDRKISVTLSGSILNYSACASFYTDQITNLDVLGKDYVVHKSSPNDVTYILAQVNSTSLTISSNTVTNWLINAGETYTVNTSNNPLTYINTDKPVYVFSMGGDGCKYGGAQLAPAYCAGSYTTAFTRDNADPFYLQIYTRSGYQSNFSLNVNSAAVPITAASFTAVPGTGNNLVGARILYNTTTIPVGAYCVLQNSADIFGLSVQYGANADGYAFSHLSNFQVNSFVTANPVSTATICSNTQFTLNGVVGGGPINGIWSTTGFGTFSAGNTQLTNNVYIPNPVDTNIVPVKIILKSTGICPNKSDTLNLTVKQGPIVTAGSGAVICSNNPTVQLSGNVYGATNQGIWSVAAPGNGTFTPSLTSFTPSYLLSNSDTAQSVLKFILTTTNNAGCNPERDTVRITVNKAPNVKASLINPLIRCANNSTVFLTGTVSGTTTSTGMWQTSGSGVFVPDNLSLICNYVPSQGDIALGSVYLKLTSTNNQLCKAISDSVKVLFTQPSSPNAGIDLNSCKNNAVAVLNGIITGTASTTGVWLGGNGTFIPSNSALTTTYYATPAEVTAGYVVLTFSTTNNGLCAGGTDQLKISFQDKPTANFTVNPVCLNQPTILTDKSLNTSGLGSLSGWDWDLADGSTTTSVSPVHTYSMAGTYLVKLIVKNTFQCYDTMVRPVVVYGLPTASINVSRACSGASQLITFQDQSSISLPDVIPSTGYYWDFGGQGFSTSRDTAFIFPSEGIYGITHIITTTNHCKSVITQSINITPKPRARFKIVNNTTLSLGANISFVDSSNIVPSSWKWYLGNGDSSSIKDPSTTYTANGTYSVSLTIADQFGCTDTFTSSITIKTIAGEITQLIPNMITPNGDGKNDIWRLDFIDVFFPTADIEIYSRWGERLFHSVGYSNAWDGSYKGDPLPVGAYFYIIKLNNKENQIYKGTITLMK